jgi:hypothetical protein
MWAKFQSYNLGCSLLDCVAGIVLESLEVLVEHICDFIQIGFVLFLIGPAVDGIQNFTIDAVQSLRVSQVENWKVAVLCFCQAAVVDSVDYNASIGDADTLNRKDSTLPTPYLPPVHPVLTSQTCTLWS